MPKTIDDILAGTPYGEPNVFARHNLETDAAKNAALASLVPGLVKELQRSHDFMRKSEMAAKLAARMPNPPEQAKEFLEVQGRAADALASASEVMAIVGAE